VPVYKCEARTCEGGRLSQDRLAQQMGAHIFCGGNRIRMKAAAGEVSIRLVGRWVDSADYAIQLYSSQEVATTLCTTRRM